METMGSVPRKMQIQSHRPKIADNILLPTKTHQTKIKNSELEETGYRLGIFHQFFGHIEQRKTTNSSVHLN